MLYFIIRPFVRIALWFFYRPFKISGLENIPKDQPVIFAPNHQNSFLDAIIPACFQPRSIHFLVRSDVFKRGLVERILYGLHMWPVYRQRDGKENMGKNEEIFDRCSKLLNDNGCLLLFPEANQVCRRILRPLSKGMARIAFQAAEESDFGKEIYIVPLGLNYEHYHSFDKGLSMRFGKPLKVLDFKEAYLENQPRGLQLLTNAISEVMLKEMIHIEDPEDEKFWFDKAGLSGHKLTSPEFFESLDVKSRPATKKKRKKINLLAELLHWPVLYYLRRTLRSKIRDEKFLGSVKFGLALVLFPLYYLLLFVLILLACGSVWIALGVIAAMVVLLKIKI